MDIAEVEESLFAASDAKVNANGGFWYLLLLIVFATQPEGDRNVLA